MRVVVGVMALLLGGCVPLPIYQEQQKKLSAALADRNALTQDILTCEKQNKRLIEALKSRPRVMTKDPIDQKELDEIKKKALEDAERRFKLRMRKGP